MSFNKIVSILKQWAHKPTSPLYFTICPHYRKNPFVFLAFKQRCEGKVKASFSHVDQLALKHTIQKSYEKNGKWCVVVERIPLIPPQQPPKAA